MKSLKIKIILLLVAVFVGVSGSAAGLFSKKSPPVAPDAPSATEPVVPLPVTTNVPPSAAPMLTWDAEVKEYTAKIGETVAPTTFFLTNASPTAVVISSVVTSCGCTTAQLPPMPWTIAPGESGKIGINMNFAGKTGTVIKTITVNSSAGNKVLQFRVVIPDLQASRSANMMIAQADRQAVFKGDCASCHVAPGVGKMGADLYKAVCGICHDAAHRASMVPDLRHLPHPTSRDHWRAWITGGKAGSLMPAFQKAQGGPLTDEQINSLVDYLMKEITMGESAPKPAAASSH